MTDSETVDRLRRLPFFGDLSEDMLQSLAPISRIIDLTPGTVLFRQGEPARAIYFMVEGTVALELCASAIGCKRLMTTGPGELLGWSPVLGLEQLTATARALSPVRVMEFEGSRLIDLCRTHPELGYELMKRTAVSLAKRLNATRLQLLNVYGEDIPSVPNEQTRSSSGLSIDDVGASRPATTDAPDLCE